MYHIYLTNKYDYLKLGNFDIDMLPCDCIVNGGLGGLAGLILLSVNRPGILSTSINLDALDIFFSSDKFVSINPSSDKFA